MIHACCAGETGPCLLRGRKSGDSGAKKISLKRINSAGQNSPAPKEKKTIRMRDIAAKLGVSTVTVSNALRGKPGVSPEVAAKVRELAVEQGYDLGRIRRGQRHETGSRILVWSPMPSDDGTDRLWSMPEAAVRTITGVLESNGSSCILRSAGSAASWTEWAFRGSESAGMTQEGTAAILAMTSFMKAPE